MFFDVFFFHFSEHQIVDQLFDEEYDFGNCSHSYCTLENSDPNALRPNLGRVKKNRIVGARQGFDMGKTPISPEQFVDEIDSENFKFTKRL